MGLIAIGDVHGCARTLEALIDQINPSQDDHLVFVGDYVDRGPDSKGVINFLFNLREDHTCTFLRGNHEALMLDYLDRGEFEMWRVNGGIPTLESYRASKDKIEIPESHVTFLRQTKLFYDAPEFFFVHAGLRPEFSIDENLQRGDERVFLWERSHLHARKFAWEKPIVCGHTPHSEPINRDKLIMIDTGCVYHTHPMLGRLTAVRLPDREFISVHYRG